MRPGQLVADRFRIERLAGRGSMGAVYRAVDKDTGKAVALKVLHGQEEELTERFTREIQLTSELEHPAIVRYVAQGVTPDRDWFLATEWLDGERLTDRLKRGPLSVPEAIAMALVASDALRVAHARNIVHRDIKPSNLFLVGGSPADVRILDFGVARIRAAGGSPLTAMGAALGTPGYMSPEQARGDGTIDSRTDVFALGCVLFRCLTGELVWEGDSPMSLLYLVVSDPARRVRSLRADVPAELDELIDRTLRKQQDDRPRDAGELWNALQPIGAAHGVHAQPGKPLTLPPGLPPSPPLGQAVPPPADSASSAPATYVAPPISPAPTAMAPAPAAPPAFAAALAQAPTPGAAVPPAPGTPAGQPMQAQAPALEDDVTLPGPSPIRAGLVQHAAIDIPSLSPLELDELKLPRRSRSETLLLIAVLATLALAVLVGLVALLLG